MTVIKFERTSPEYKRGFEAAMRMISAWCKSNKKRKISDIEHMLEAGLMLNDLVCGDKE